MENQICRNEPAVCQECGGVGRIRLKTGPHKLRDGRIIEAIYCEYCPEGKKRMKEAYFPGKSKTFTILHWLNDTVKALHAKHRKGRTIEEEFDEWAMVRAIRNNKRLLN